MAERILAESAAKTTSARCPCDSLWGYNPVTMSEHRTQGMALDNVSQLLRAWSDGDQLALGELTPIVYAELHRLAHRYMRGERSGHSLQTTALVHEAYMRLVDYKQNAVAEPGPFLRGIVSVDAPHSGRPCATS